MEIEVGERMGVGERREMGSYAKMSTELYTYAMFMFRTLSNLIFQVMIALIAESSDVRFWYIGPDTSIFTFKNKFSIPSQMVFSPIR